MKRTPFRSFALLLSTVAVFALCVSAASAQTTLKLGVVDLKRVFDNYYKTKDAASRMKDVGTSFQKEMQDMMADYQKMVDEATKLKTAAEDKTLSKEAQDQKRKVFEVKVQDIKNMERKLREFEVTRRKQLEDQQVRVVSTIRDEILKVVKDTSARRTFNLVYDLSGISMNGSNVVLYSANVEDITDDVLRQINANQPAPGAAPAPGTATTPAAAGATAPKPAVK